MLRTSKLPARTCQLIGRDHPGQGDLFSYVAPNQSGGNWEVTSDLPIWLFNQTIFRAAWTNPKTFGSIFKGAGINFKQICRCRRRHVFHVGHMWQFGMHPSWDSTTRWVFCKFWGAAFDKISDLLTPQFSDHEQIHKKGNVAILKYNGGNQSK